MRVTIPIPLCLPRDPLGLPGPWGNFLLIIFYSLTFMQEVLLRSLPRLRVVSSQEEL